jgi:hypothetical protein
MHIKIHGAFFYDFKVNASRLQLTIIRQHFLRKLRAVTLRSWWTFVFKAQPLGHAYHFFLNYNKESIRRKQR